MQRGDRNFYLGDHRAYLGVQAAVDELDRRAEPGDRLLVGPSDLRRTWYSDVFIYWLFPELEPATYYIEMDPGLANAEGSSLAGDVASADWVILTGLWDGWMEPNSSMEFGSDAPNQVLATTSASSATTRTARRPVPRADRALRRVTRGPA